MDSVTIVWWTLFVAMVSFNLGVWIRVRLIKYALMNEMVSIEIARQKAARMIEAVDAVTCVDYHA
jgi:hypothetical protein